jgi:hypothetical protein
MFKIQDIEHENDDKKNELLCLKNQKFILLKKLKIGVEEPVNQTNKKCQINAFAWTNSYRRRKRRRRNA